MPNMRLALVLGLSVLGLTGPTATARAGPSATGTVAGTVHYTVRMPRPVTHFFEVEVRVPRVSEEGFRFAFPAWAPGGYVIREVAANVVDLTVTDGSGRLVPVRKIDKQTWSVPAIKGTEATVRYRVHADERGTPYAARLNADMAHMNLVRVLGYVENRLGEAFALTLVPWGDWKTACSLPERPGEPGTFYAPDWDTLADGIALLGHWHEMRFEEGGATYRLVFSERPDTRNRDVIADVRAISRESAAIFGGAPFDAFLFVYLLEPESGRGGIEHLDGTSIALSRDVFREREEYLRFLGVTAHELIHAWNVKRLRPRGLGPFDYSREVHTRLLYVAEGFTSYLGPLAEVRGGAVDRDEFFEALADRIRRDRDNPGTRLKSLEEFSWDSWLQSEIPYLTFRTYYTRGALVATILDLEIRHATAGKRSLNDVMRALYETTATRAEGFTDAELRSVLTREGAAGMDRRLDELVSQAGEIDIGPALALAGLEVVADPDTPPVPRFGARLDGTGNAFPEIDWVEPGSPAESAALQSGDLVLALEGRRVDAGGWSDRLRDMGPGASVEVAFFRAGRLERTRVALGDPVPEALLVRPLDDATVEQKALREAWLSPGGESP